MAKKKNDPWPIDEWDESLDSGKQKQAPDPFYGPLGSARQNDDEDWDSPISTELTGRQRGKRTKSIPPKSVAAILSAGVVIILLAVGIPLVNKDGHEGQGGTSAATISSSTLCPTSTETEIETHTPTYAPSPTPTHTPTQAPSPTPTKTSTPSPTEEPAPVSALTDNDWYGPEMRYYYQQLTDHEKQVFEDLYNGLMNYETKISISPCTDEEFQHVSYVLFSDSPELFHYTGGGTMWGLTKYTEYEPNYRIDQATYRTTCAHIHKVIEEIKAGLPDLAGDYEIEKAVHYWLIDHCEYLHTREDDSTALADACLYYGRSQCSGYARANALLLRSMGVHCLEVTSSTHEWNIVKINSRWYQCDATWDDGDGSYPWKQGGNRYAGWFNVPDKLVNDFDHQQDHSSGFSVPSCNSLQDNYAYREGIYVQAGKDDPAKYIADSLKAAAAAGKYTVNVLIDDPKVTANWEQVQDRIWHKYNTYDWVFFPPQDTQTAYMVYEPR